MKKRIILTESEKESILNLHSEFKKRLVEQATTGTTTGNTSTTTGSTTGNTSTTTSGKTPEDRKTKIKTVQTLINDKCPADKLPNKTKLVVDGIWGPKTNAAFTACGGVISGAQSAPTTVTPQAGTPQAGTTVNTAAQKVTGTQTTPGFEELDISNF